MALEIKLPALNNCAQCNLILRQWRQAIKFTNEVNTPIFLQNFFQKALEIDSLNLKALYRRARANIQLGEVISHVLLVSFQLILAKSDLAKILKADPENKVAAKELQRVKQLRVKQKRKEMEMSKQIIDNMSYYERH